MIPEALKAALVADLNNRINTNNTRAITGAIMNDFINDFIASIQGSIIKNNVAPNSDIDRVFWRDSITNDLSFYNENTDTWNGIKTRYRLSDFDVKGDGTDESLKVQYAIDFLTDFSFGELVCDVKSVVCKNVTLHSRINLTGTDCTFKSPDTSPVFISTDNLDRINFTGITFDACLGVYITGNAADIGFYNVTFKNSLIGLRIAPTPGNFVKGVYIAKSNFILSGCELTGAVTAVSIYENTNFSPYAGDYVLKITNNDNGQPSVIQLIGANFSGYQQSTVGNSKAVNIVGSSEVVFFNCSLINFNRICDISNADLVSFKYCKIQSISSEYAIGVNSCTGFNFEGNKISGNVSQAFVKQTSQNIEAVKYLYQKNNIFGGTNISKVFDFVHTLAVVNNSIPYYREFLLLEAGTDSDIDTITDAENGSKFITGQIITLQSVTPGITITVKTGLGNIILPSGDVTLSGLDSILTLQYNGSTWIGVSGVSEGNESGAEGEISPINGLINYGAGEIGLGGQLQFDTLINMLTHELAFENGSIRIGSDTVNGKLTVYGDIEIKGINNGIIFTDAEGDKFRIRFKDGYYFSEPIT